MSYDRGAAEDAARKQRQCVGKRGYLDPSEAKHHAKLMHKKYKAKFAAYECPWCGLHHVGTNRTERQGELRRLAASV